MPIAPQIEDILKMSDTEVLAEANKKGIAKPDIERLRQRLIALFIVAEAKGMIDIADPDLDLSDENISQDSEEDCEWRFVDSEEEGVTGDSEYDTDDEDPFSSENF